jgi:peptide/nickel transport system permease protein
VSAAASSPARRSARFAVSLFVLFGSTWLAIVLLRVQALGRLWARHDLEDVVALAFLALFPVGLVLLALRTARSRRRPPRRDGLGVWALAWRAFKKRPRGVWGLVLLGFVYMVAFLCPVLAPYDPLAQPSDTLVNQYLAPGDSVWVFGDTEYGERYGLSWWVQDGALMLERGKDAPPRRVPLDRLGEPRRGWSRAADTVRTMEIAGKAVPYRKESHLLGTDRVGRDLLSRIVYGSRISLTIGFAAMAVAISLGTLFGALSGYFGGFTDGAIMRFVDVLLAFPRLLLLLLIISAWQGAGVLTVIVVLGATGWMGVSRLVRAQVLQLKELDYTAAARAMGFSQLRIVFRHMIPNAMAPVIVAGTLMVGGTILVESALSFLGMGVHPPTPTWGNIVNDGSDALREAWWIATVPGLAIVVTVVCFNLVGDALRDAMDPRQRT